jgi:hypothetical protein
VLLHDAVDELHAGGVEFRVRLCILLAHLMVRRAVLRGQLGCGESRRPAADLDRLEQGDPLPRALKRVRGQDPKNAAAHHDGVIPRLVAGVQRREFNERLARFRPQ